MPEVDASIPLAGNPQIPLAVQSPQIDYASLVSTAFQLKQLQQQAQTQNALKAVLSQPGAVDPKTGDYNTNALAQVMRIDPTIGSKLSDEQASRQQHRADMAHATSESQTADLTRHSKELNGALALYDTELSSGNVAPEIAANNLKTSIHDYIQDQPWADDRKTAVWGQLEGMQPKDLRALAGRLSISQAAQTAEDKPQIFVGPGGVPEVVTLNPATGGLTVKDAKGNPVDGPIQKPGTQMDPQRAAMEERRLALAEKVAEGGAGALTDDDLSFVAEQVLNGSPMPNMGYGAKGAAARAAILHKAAEMARSQSGSPEAGADDIVVRRDSLKADQASLQAVTRQQASVSQFSETALGLADKVEQMMSKGTTKAGPEWLAGLVQKIKTGQLGDPDTREFLGYITDLESENAKIMAGATGSVAQVSAHNQALMSQILRGDMPASEMAGALKAIRSGIELRNKSLDDEIARQKEHLHADTAGGGHAAPAPPSAPITATGPNGRKALWNGKAWVDATTGKPF